MEQFNGAGCCLCFVVITLTHQNGRIKCGLTICREEVTRKDFSIAWPLTVTFSTCAIQGNSEGNKVDTSLQDNMEIQYNWIEYIYHVGSFDYRREKIRKKEDKRYFSAVDPMSEPREDQPYDVTKPRQVPDRTRWKVHWNAVYWINLGSAQDQGLVFWQTLSDAIIFHNSAPADCLEQVVKTQTGKILYQKTHSSLRLPPMVTLRNAWQVQHEDQHHRGTCAGQLAANEVEMEPTREFRIQGLSHAAVEQEEDSRTRLIRRLVHQVMHPNKDALTVDLQSNRPCTVLSKEESKHVIHTVENVECVELCTTHLLLDSMFGGLQCLKCVGIQTF